MVDQDYKQRLEKFYSGLIPKLQIYRKEKQRWNRDYKQRLEGFYSGLIPKLQIYRQEKRRWDRFLSTDFNVVSEFIRPNENRLSDIIACLLEANGSHGQGSTFLDGFLKCLYEKKHFDTDIKQRPYFLKHLFEKKRSDRVAELSEKQPQVKREDRTHYNENQSRRIDITIDFEEIFGIGIENKPWAGEQEYQLSDYYSHLKDKYKNEEFCLVFITPNGTHPKTIGKPKEVIELIEKGELYCLSYNSDILPWIEECGQLCESDRFRWFLRDFKEYIHNAFPPSLNTKENDDANE